MTPPRAEAPIYLSSTDVPTPTAPIDPDPWAFDDPWNTAITARCRCGHYAHPGGPCEVPGCGHRYHQAPRGTGAIA